MADIINPVIVESNGELVHVTASGERKQVRNTTGIAIYSATINPETKEITLDNGSDIAQLPVGNEILLEDGVYKKVKEYHTIGSPANGTRIEVSGITNPVEANGAYMLS